MNFSEYPVMQTSISNFADAQQEYVAYLPEQRHDKPFDLQLGDRDIQLNVLKKKFTICPTVYLRVHDHGKNRA